MFALRSETEDNSADVFCIVITPICIVTTGITGKYQRFSSGIVFLPISPAADVDDDELTFISEETFHKQAAQFHILHHKPLESVLRMRTGVFATDI